MEVKVYCEQFKEMLGVERISQIFIDIDGFLDEEKSEKTFNALAERLYFTENKSWKSQIKEDVAEKIGCKISDIVIKFE